MPFLIIWFWLGRFDPADLHLTHDHCAYERGIVNLSSCTRSDAWKLFLAGPVYIFYTHTHTHTRALSTYINILYDSIPSTAPFSLRWIYVPICVFILYGVFVCLSYIFIYLSNSSCQRSGPETVEEDRKTPRRRRGRRWQEGRSDRRRPTAEFAGSSRSRRR